MRSQTLKQIAITCAIVLTVCGCNSVLNRWFHLDSPLLAFFVAITVCAWIGGFYQGFLASLLSLGCVFAFFSNSYLLAQPTGTIRCLIFIFDGLLISTVCSQLIASRQKLRVSEERARGELEAKVAERTTQANAALAELTASRSFLDSVFEHLPNMVFVKEAATLNFVRMNRAGARALAKTREELIGKNDRDLFSAPEAESFLESDRRVLASKTDLDIKDETFRGENGEIRHLQTKRIPILDSTNKPVFLLGISEDVTEARRQEARKFELLQAATAKAEAERVSEQMRELAHAANEASRAKSAFMANISHEIRTPLGAMLGFAELAADDKVMDDAHSERLRTIARNGNQLLQIVNEILDVSKVESSHIQIDQIEFNLSEIVSDTLKLLHVKASEKSVFLKSDLSLIENRIVSSDPLRVRQILMNIIGNAIKFTERGSVSVHATATSLACGRTRFTLSVQDSGIGLTDEQAARIFQAFVQADETMSRRYGGTGLGLFLSRKLAQLLGGDIRLLKSQLGEGSVFEIEFVLKEAEAKAVRSAETHRMSPSFGALPFTKVLVVDDASDNRQLLSNYLSRAQIDVQLATNGRECVEIAMRDQFDVILLDIQMPEMDGLQAVVELRKRDYRKPIIALTAHAMRGDRERCLAAGFDDYLQKPVDRRLLLETIGRFTRLQTSQSPELR